MKHPEMIKSRNCLPSLGLQEDREKSVLLYPDTKFIVEAVR